MTSRVSFSSTEDSERMRKIGRTVAAAAGDGVAFALFVGKNSATHYASNGMRADIVAALEEWLGRTANIIGELNLAVATAQIPDETPAARDARLELERKCSVIGIALTSHLEPGDGVNVSVFLFTVGDAGACAYWTNNPNLRGEIEIWCRTVRAMGRA